LLLMRKGGPEMVSVELSTREGDGQVVVVLRGELDVTEAAKVAASLAVVAASGRTVIVDLEGLEFIDSSGLAALVRARQHARRAGFDLLLAAPQHQVLRMLAITRLIDVFAVHARVDEAAGIAGRIPVAIARAAGNPAMPGMATRPPCGLLAAGDAV
jgi:anti-anti-sigma factor